MSENWGFSYNPDRCQALRASLSEDRFGRYLGECDGREPDALQLYTWNTAVASAFYGPLQACEVTLRNAVHREMSKYRGQWWFRNDPRLYGDELRMAKDAIATIERLGKDLTSGRVVAELGFGYWVGLFAKAYDTSLWRDDLHRAFAARTQRRSLFDTLDRLRTLRNRVAHHEPIFQRNLTADYERVLDVLTLLSPPVTEWVRQHSRIEETLGRAHDETHRF